MRESTELFENSAEKRTKSMNGHSTTASDDDFEPDMDLDEPLKDGDDWDRMDTEEADNGMKYQTLLEVIIRYGQELKHEFKDNRSKLVTETFKVIFSMFSYPNPSESPHGNLLDTRQRVPVAEGLNSAILGTETA